MEPTTEFVEYVARVTKNEVTLASDKKYKQFVSEGPTPDRALFATKEILDEGFELWCEVPVSAVPYLSHVLHVCSYCLKEYSKSASLPRCGGCSTMFYCSRSCQASDWKQYHKQECSYFKMFMLTKPDTVTDTHSIPTIIRFTCRALLARTSPEGALRWDLAVKALCHSLPPNYKCDPNMLDPRFVYRFASQVVPHHVLPDFPEFVKFWNASERNVFGLGSLSGAFQPSRHSLYLVTSMINHSCDPNVYVCSSGGRASVRALRPIAAGEILTASYVDPLCPFEQRTKSINEIFFFRCACPRCCIDRQVRKCTDQVKVIKYLMEIKRSFEGKSKSSNSEIKDCKGDGELAIYFQFAGMQNDPSRGAIPTLFDLALYNKIRVYVEKKFGLFHPWSFYIRFRTIQYSFLIMGSRVQIKAQSIVLKSKNEKSGKTCYWPSTPSSLLTETQNLAKRLNSSFPNEELEGLKFPEFFSMVKEFVERCSPSSSS